ncbi:hypothetical protein DEA8626_01380 [Defluviimonas aquaemixtae]|uniref:PAS domain-containing protein n=1 Tax=Albidovulum aquaemixtae TaxID=1542388 RepID=A0A2R8B5P9_9RHOB|nr:PAS domain-containing protein [Defluviimonas aquaemixtae]SPH17853.1 hypothetical protein DEA8626_01380 [Defluviimonas aquaemixtae]
MNVFIENRGKVVPLTGNHKTMRFQCISDVRAYWEALRDGRAAPFRSEVDPRGIERALEYAFVLERIAPQVARFRLAGMHLTDLMGMEVRGMPVTAFFTPEARAEASAALEAVFSGPNTAELSLRAEPGLGRPALEARLLILPLRSDLGDMTRALGCLTAEGPIGRTPRRFDVVSATVRPISAVVPGPARAPRTPMPNGFAESPAEFALAQPPAIRSRGHLRLVKSDS